MFQVDNRTVTFTKSPSSLPQSVGAKVSPCRGHPVTVTRDQRHGGYAVVPIGFSSSRTDLVMSESEVIHVHGMR